MRIMFIKDLIDIEEGMSPVIIRFGDKGTLIDEVTSTIVLDSGPTIEFVNPGKFLPLSD